MSACNNIMGSVSSCLHRKRKERVEAPGNKTACTGSDDDTSREAVQIVLTAKKVRRVLSGANDESMNDFCKTLSPPVVWYGLSEQHPVRIPVVPVAGNLVFRSTVDNTTRFTLKMGKRHDNVMYVFAYITGKKNKTTTRYEDTSQCVWMYHTFDKKENGFCGVCAARRGLYMMKKLYKRHLEGVAATQYMRERNAAALALLGPATTPDQAVPPPQYDTIACKEACLASSFDAFSDDEL